MSSSLRILCLSSSTPKGGSTVKAVLGAINAGSLPNVEIVALATTRPNAGVRSLALQCGMEEREMVTLPPSSAGKEALAEAILQAYTSFGANCIWQNGWTRHTPAQVVQYCYGRIINQHGGALNPAATLNGKRFDFGGSGMKGRATFAAQLYYAHMIKADFQARAVTHFVTEEIDGGGVIREWKVPIFKNDTVETLARRMGPVEKMVQIATLGDFASHGRVSVIQPEGIAHTALEVEALQQARARAIADYPNG